ncbi:hypothetical protein LCGC14_2182030 [marine sediment metagenome]|uniref:Uncharacterized protein n=1 Tax=marine sediment metagenome TaxID=412755 RepID=A0A0F9FZL1_9ZZZZ
MAANPEKTEIINMAISVLREGKTSSAGQFYDDITDAEFADYTTITGSGTQGKQRAVFQYEKNFKEVLRDMKPEFARQFADLNEEILINKEIANWLYLFELPTDFFNIVAQVSEDDRTVKYDKQVMTFDSYAHVVVGTDNQSWKCKVAHTAADANKPTTGVDYLTNWELFNTDPLFGATWVSGWAYKTSQDGKLLATSNYSNSDGDSAYIQYIPYVQAGINDKPEFYPDEFKRAFAVRLASALTKDVEKQNGLLARYNNYEKSQAFDTEDKDRFKGNIVPNQNIITARRTLVVK